MTFRYGRGQRLTVEEMTLAYRREADQPIVKRAEDAGILKRRFPLCKCCGREVLDAEGRRTGLCARCGGSLSHRGECVLCQMRRQGFA